MENNIILRENVYNQIIKIEDAKGVYELFSILGYPEGSILDLSSKRRKSTFEFKKEDNERIKEIYSVLNLDDKLPVFLLETTTLVPSFIRSVTNTLDKQYIQYLLIFTTDYNGITFVFPDKEKVETGKHKLKLIKLNVDKEDIRTKKAYYSVIETLANFGYENKTTWREVWKKWKKAFSVERVTEAFFDGYKEVFFKLRSELQRQMISSKESHEFTLQFLNRIMFIYFISKKDWLEEPKFVDWLWTKYRVLGKYNSNEFYEKWLKQVFLKAFNNRANEVKGLPEDVVKVISNAPYLNGGLFRENGLDNLKILITDKIFQEVLEFFESYNFTIKEDMPLESEVAVDPQMIGYVYESLANVAEEIYDRNDLGIFYTPRVEVDFMCRRSLVEYLSKNLSELPKEKFYSLIFDPAEEREKIEDWFTKNEHWRKLEDTLSNLSVVDPACGSGAFLVGMLNVVSDLYRMIYKYIGNSLSDFALKNRVIQYSLYGVDVMPWAIHAAELRLWLQLIVETEFKKEELRQHPLLPNLNLNLRVGDSLVQEIGGISFNLRTNNLKDHLNRKLDDLKQEKRKYFENSPTAKFKSPEEVKEEEIHLFEEIINERVESLTTDIQVFEHNIKIARSQKTLAGEQVIDEKKVNENLLRINTNKEEIEKLRNVKNHLNDPEKKPFVWDIDFAEIFSEKEGFDIVIGNPPYVRQEMISPPNKLKSEVTSEEKKEYKDKLIESVKERFPVLKDVGKRSDYYIYFYFHGLSLLNNNGSFCFITSNSWLDVEYGKVLQEFLCKYVPITAIYDNPKRSFTHADVNTIIALFGAPEAKQRSLGDWFNDVTGGNEKVWPNIKSVAKFIMFKKPFEEVLSSQNLVSIENVKVKEKRKGITDLVKNVVSTNDCRIFPMLQEDLLEDGWEYPENYKNGRFKSGSYEGNKWGGKYLRAPDIFYIIMERGEESIIPLNKLADSILPGCYTGVNDFFYIDDKAIETFKIEEYYVKPIIRNADDVEALNITITPNNYVLAVPSLSKKELILEGHLGLMSYIEWGEKQVTRKRQKTESGIRWSNVETVKHRKYWYSIPEKNLIPAHIFIQYVSNERFYCPYSNFPLASDRAFHRLFEKTDINYKELAAILNSTIQIFFVMLLGRSNLGQGALKFETSDAKKILTLDVERFNSKVKRQLQDLLDALGKRKPQSIFEEVGIDREKPIREQKPNPLPDRAELDNIIFDELGLTQGERKEVYWSVCELVKQRIDKAKSLRD